ncbi:hypothetical protein GIB67_042689 [Kingdonia uniflora]|uniref:Protein kinase domain-containing protein n=1 Tax=Kingdonia uniflora TaxID=39325 RepID=A0A7J7NDX0_9MAGN|nr:hypothetical protein GIB67_042689 [Kingdonia uniflora]
MADDKFDLQTINPKLTGPNYAFWSDTMTYFIMGRGLWDYIDGAIMKPTDSEKLTFANDLRKWQMNNSKIITWISNSIELSIGVQLAKFQMAKERQGDCNIQKFYGVMTVLWDQLALTEPLGLTAYIYLSINPNVVVKPLFQFIGATLGNSKLSMQTDNGQMGMPSNVCCVVVEYLAGGTLKTCLIKNHTRKLTFGVVIQLALDLARGLSYLHSKKIVHRDVKTENMLLDRTRTLKIADFGVARIEAQNPSYMTGETGTLGYMTPEVFNGNPYNRKCDVYSFGICLWEVYCCDMLYPDLSFADVTSAVVRQNRRPEMPRCCPSSLANVMKRCWNADPDKRPEMDEVVAMLEAIDPSKGRGMIPDDQHQGCLRKICWI